MKKGNLLIVDDEEEIIEIIKMATSYFVDKIFTADNGPDALKIVASEDIHCVVCDIKMPEMSGAEVIKKIREQGNDVPFIFLTAYSNQEMMIEAIKYGAFDFLDKLEIDELEEIIERGLCEGVDMCSRKEVSEETYMSEYQKLLNDLDDGDQDRENKKK